MGPSIVVDGEASRDARGVLEPASMGPSIVVDGELRCGPCRDRSATPG
jgi:hypothetical protein